jgi:hypothetical protein
MSRKVGLRSADRSNDEVRDALRRADGASA